MAVHRQLLVPHKAVTETVSRWPLKKERMKDRQSHTCTHMYVPVHLCELCVGDSSSHVGVSFMVTWCSKTLYI